MLFPRQELGLDDDETRRLHERPVESGLEITDDSRLADVAAPQYP
jgi:hypothetical protein